ncbi:hypothetical protein PSH49_20835 [Pseudoalteromonas sp. GABNS16G]|uniref:hypothetical protein n=2 Tax=unclassified Pseudoalteromonas TaxID=194690 RepID=UPI0023586C53|nr:hypothetical protein [Pseudoalteromonas sp. GABNS16G]MDC9603037.1 hypothetical protein [Pseudoalteromonas sp. GABNS16G]
MKIANVLLAGLLVLALTGCSKGPSVDDIREDMQSTARDFVEVQNVEILEVKEEGERHVEVTVYYEVYFMEGIDEVMSDMNMFAAGKLASTMGRFNKGEVRNGEAMYRYRKTNDGWTLVD